MLIFARENRISDDLCIASAYIYGKPPVNLNCKYKREHKNRDINCNIVAELDFKLLIMSLSCFKGETTQQVLIAAKVDVPENTIQYPLNSTSKRKSNFTKIPNDTQVKSSQVWRDNFLLRIKCLIRKMKSRVEAINVSQNLNGFQITFTHFAA